MLDFPATFNRPFRLWSYAVSHSVLLLRSTIESGFSTRLDVMFREVAYVAVRQTYRRVTLNVIEGHMAVGLSAELQLDLSGLIAFSLGEGGGSEERDLIIAGSVFIAEDDLSSGEPSVIDHREMADHAVFQDRYYQS